MSGLLHTPEGVVDLAQFKRLTRPVRKYDTDPPSAKSTGGHVLSRPIFDIPRLQKAIADGLVAGIPELPDPNDEKLIACVVALGMPRWSAEQMRYHPGLRLAYLRTFWDVQDAARGVAEAQERVDAHRAYFDEARRIELVTDDPEMSIGIWER